jgi:peptidoglycan/xylan/chitin deacetylase (PgdA/CDA1 family)
MVRGALDAAVHYGRSTAATLQLLCGRRVTAGGAIVFSYHDVSVAGTTDYQVSPQLLGKHLEWALRWGVSFVPLSELVSRLLAGASVDGLGAVAFDDALAGVGRHGADVLRQLGVPATIFVVSAHLGAAPAWWQRSDRTMTVEELSSLIADGHEIGSHTRTHRDLRGLRGDELTDEVLGSREELEALFQRRVDLVAYPGGHFDGCVVKAVQDAGYRAGFSFLNGRIVRGMDAFRLPRLNMWSGQHRWRLAYHLSRPVASWGEVCVETA